jgi:DNA-binding NtrC family response regulator
VSAKKTILIVDDHPLIREGLKNLISANPAYSEPDYARDQFWKSEWLDVVHSRTLTMQAVFKKLRAVVLTRASVLLTGEIGTGKTLFARLLHSHSNRCNDPFISVHCGAIPDTLLESELFGHEKGAFTGAARRMSGKFELAKGGTIFLARMGTSVLFLYFTIFTLFLRSGN